ncbi:ATP-binding protein [Silvimonas amylolytica]|uniref:histidine kinase n=1 Tax=Silvimonas amylolytica TaxID=449663 RepID=A0ABQ2PKD6_9NEIS|nr:ATP-binding protein [Silvimonas amylolytica]GGP26075.1 histidine kinase [Silvimonas amylolytica]
MASAEQQCAQEPIRFPGSIQPHGFLLIMDAATLVITQASQNVSDWLGVDYQRLVETHFGQWVDTASPGAVTRLAGDYAEPHHLGTVLLRHADGSAPRFEWVAHRLNDQVIAEFEPAEEGAEQAFSTMYPLVRTFVNKLHDAKDIQTMCALAVSEVKRMTGYGRVLAYRFDEDDHGHVIAEEADDGYARYLDLHFPASDIPRQARELYVLNRIRVIQDASYQASLILPAAHPRTGAPLDLSFAMLRSVSPIHLQYMKNMGTLASMSLSIVINNRLWGLISCHDHQATPVRFHVRTGCELLGNILSLQIEAKEAHDVATRMLTQRQQVVRILSTMADRDGVNEGLLAVPEVLLHFANANGAAIVSASGIDLIGDTPPLATIKSLVAWLAQKTEHEIYTTDCISRDLPDALDMPDRIGGLMAVSISELHNHYLIWFRQETTRTVNWAGEPVKQTAARAGVQTLNPRTSFATWQQTLRGNCPRWLETEIEGALELRSAVLGIVLRKAEELAQLADDLKKSNRELEAFSYSVSHDLRAPLRHIASYAELMIDTEHGKLTERGQHFLDNIADSSRFAGQLVDNLLMFSQLGRSVIRLGEVNVNELIETIRHEMQPDYQDRQIKWHVQPLGRVRADGTFLHLALRNLIANAIKYTRTRELACIEIGARHEDARDVLYVKDNGVGFDMQYVGKLFGVFQRLHRMEDFEGTGIGLANVRRIVERHHGQTWAEGEPDAGATFFIALPRPGIGTAKRKQDHAKTDPAG